MRQTLGIQERDFLWLAIGRQEPQKDYPNLLDAFGRIVSPETHLLIVGKRTMQEELAALVEQKELQEQVTFLGLRRDIPALLAAADALVLASAWEGLPNVVMEALAAAVPVVATAVGGVPELVVEGESGYLVPPRNPQALASAMVRLMGHSNEERVRMGEAGRGHILSGFEISVVMVVWEDMMHGLLKGREVKC
jgi:glycosyltransferase involved in cell wall biosynthesis